MSVDPFLSESTTISETGNFKNPLATVSTTLAPETKQVVFFHYHHPPCPSIPTSVVLEDTILH
jgi:hypothetical protein